MKRLLAKIPALVLTLIVGIVASPCAFGAATIVIDNTDKPGVGFNDPTPVSPIGGNAGTTLGQQRLNAFQFAANVWGATLTSGPTITIRASWPNDPNDPNYLPLACTPTTAVLGSAGAASLRLNFLGAPFRDTWYSAALANAISGTDPFPTTAEINARFNVNLGNTGCLDGRHWYLGLDGNHGSDVDLVSVLIHEFAHGLGFQTFTSSSTGQQATDSQNRPFPSIYDRFLLDNSTGKTWAQMTDAERAASAINTGNLVWNGSQVTSDAPTVLGTPRLRIKSPSSITGSYQVGTADFGPSLSFPGIVGNVVQALDPADSSGASTTDGCSPLTNAAAVSGKIALIDRGTCTFVTKVKNAQNAGAVGVLIVENTTDSPPAGLGGSDSTITIPAVRITLADGNTIKAQLPFGVGATLLLDRSTAGGADQFGHPRLFTPNPIQSGSSVSHWDTTAFPNQLMEPNISSDLSHSVTLPQDLTASLMKDIGWTVTGGTLPPPTSLPGNDNFASAQTISGCAGSVAGTNINATKETGEPSHSPDNNAGGGSVWYQWQAPNSGSVTITTAGSNFDTVLAVYNGSGVGSLTPIVKNDDTSGTDHTSSITFNATAGTIYKIAVDGWGGDRSSVVLNWTASNCGSVAPTVLTEDGTNVAAALDSVTKVHGPFPIHSTSNFSTDHFTRVMIFTSDLGLSQPDSSILSVQAQGISLPVENVGTVPGFSQFSYIVVRLTDQLPTGNLQLVITLRGVPSSVTTIGIK